MHIAHFTNTYLPLISGVVRSVSSFRKALTGLGHNVFVFTSEASDYEDEEPFIFRYPAIKIPGGVDFPAVIPISPFIDQLLPALKLDVIHAHHPILVGGAAANKASELNLPLVFTFHTQYREYSHYFPMPQEAVQDLLKGAIDSYLRDFMKKCNHIIVPTESFRQQLERSYGLVERVTVIPTGIDLEPYRQADGEAMRAERGWNDDKIMISVGRMALEKNWRTLLKAASLAISSHPDLRVVLIGDGPDRDDLQEYALELGIAERVEFVGKVLYERIPAFLKAADFFCFASVTETQGLASVEALAAGLPVVAIDATGTRDVVKNGQDGILTENSAEALAEGILRLLRDPDMQNCFRSAALDRAREFDIMEQARKMVAVYQQASEAKKAGQLVRLYRQVRE
jgi:1,2-diacylglycerol 3-alpha-glucosyltransferase